MQKQNEEAALAVTVRWGEDHDTVSLAGEFDFSAASRVRAVVDALLVAGRRRILIDLDAVTFVDGAAIGALIAANEQTLLVGGALEVTEHALCLRLLRVTNELPRLTVHQSAAEVGIGDAVAPITRARATVRQERRAKQ